MLDEIETLPEAAHIELVMTGLMDTVSGNESLSLTYAQRYLEGAMFASGVLRSSALADVAGNEGIFSAIGTGLEAIWNYIKKMFSSIWNFFFGGGDETPAKKSEKAQSSIKKAEKAIADVAHPTTVAKAEVVVHIATAAINRTPAVSAPHEVQKAQEEVKGIIDTTFSKGSKSTDSEKCRAAATIAKTLPVINYKRVESIQAKISKLVDSSNDFYDGFAKSQYTELFKGTELEQPYHGFMVGAKDSAVPGATEKVSAKARSMKTSEEALIVLQALEVLRKAYNDDTFLVNSRKSELSGSVSRLEERIKHHEGNGKDPKSLRVSLDNNKAWISTIAKLGLQLKIGLETITFLADEIAKIFGITSSYQIK